MQFPMYTSGSSNPAPANGPPDQKHLQQNHAPTSQVQQGYIYPPPPPASSKQYHSHLPPVSMLPPPPPLPPGSIPPSQAFPYSFHPPPSFPLSFPPKSLEPPRMPLPPPCESVSLNGRALDIHGEDVVSTKDISDRCIGESSSSSPLEKKAEHGSPLYDDPDIEMEDDITLPESYQTQPLNHASDQLHKAYSNTEQLPPQPVSAETNTTLTGTAMNFETNLPVSKSDTAQTQQDVDDGSRQASSSPYSGRGAKVVPVGDMYDPFVDSFEPASLKLDCVQEHEPVCDSYTLPKASISSNSPLNAEENNQGVVDKQAPNEFDMTARVSVSSNKPPDVEANTAGNDIRAVTSENNDEVGENAESGREGNSHETLTPNSNNENSKADNNVREADSTRKKSRGDAKEKDSSRSMKLFKVALTKFVKDLLKPSWRQGNMSKEAFKTIVKRAVDKVSNSMEGRRVPKSKAKIDKYIDSSRDKLSKLVMGYVDKYVKA